MLRRSLDACLQGGETMRVMALLPLAQLYRCGEDEREVAGICTEILQMIDQSTLLNRAHFLALLQLGAPGKVLPEVSLHPGRYFPFSYR